ncbi:hypothetical protein [uncultured Turicimonas sp.]|uniref:hypothetical protein n=1 Tax=uncultured Turicimonas sp. TaxID=1918607 RepID=UPI0028064D2E|nr:hypothetical protein [uncultured Turicimonas sp.]
MYSNIKDFLIFQEPEGIIGYREDDLYRFAGPRALIASALVFRLMKEAVKDLSPNEIPCRKDFTVISGHSGPGVKDGFEYLTRAVSEGRYLYDPDKARSNAPAAPASAAEGFMYFEIGYRGKAIRYVLADDIFDSEWFSQVRKHQEGSSSTSEHSRYLMYKDSVVSKLRRKEEIFKQKLQVEEDLRFN